MKRKLTILVEELRRLKEEGVTVLSVSEEAMDGLRKRVGQLTGGERAEASEPGAVRRRSRFEMAGATRLPDFDPEPDVAAKLVPKAAAPVGNLPPPPEVALPAGDKQRRWEALREQVMRCPTCRERAEPSGQPVFGVGDLDAELFFVGEAPAEAEVSGGPFAGRPGETLARMIGAMGLTTEAIYFSHAMNWRPVPATGTGNRQPTPEELVFCRSFLEAQIEIVKPKVLVALGNTVVNTLFGADPKRRLKDIRGQWLEFNGIATMVTYHPAYLTRSGSNAVKRVAWEDLLKVMERLGLEISAKQRGYFLPKR